ncbi:unnamed protein product [marine sediment metagenome]|uniref:Putative zinc-finger domain-containing protein n=1 Tax=marine sediment metagenome TaxID=412755 RepID=X1INB7_9ZZZZ
MVIKQVKCKKIKKLLQLYLDNALTFGEKQMVEKHLKECSACRAELKSLSPIVKMIESLSEISPPPDFTENVMSKISQVKR